ncbi:Arylsulfatase precursor [Planctomycetes bacterium Pan216]|uniref:Arylsulfatase n=1 Tax=Kolteria novifilia TaxID=2527975 RepID=A0A518AX89_9BACT|nr:Arylsulfatase precursor [Planctomycetes bacterium Pan216]
MTTVRRSFALLVLASSMPFSAIGAELPSKPNVIVIVADDLGYADVSYQGCRDFDTPHLDALAASGVDFTNGYVTHPYCSPSRAGILTGRYQQRFGHEHNPPFAPEDDSIGTPTDEVFLGQLLKRSGYATAAIGKWHLGDAPKFLPHHRGFDEFFGFSAGGHDYYGRTRGPHRRIQRNDKTVTAEEITYLTDDFTDEAVSFVERHQSEPFFLYLAYNAPHSPNHATQHYLDRTWHIEDGFRTVYAAMILGVDDGVGRLMTTLDQLDLRERTLVFFISDNGGRLGSDNRPLRGHKGMLFEGGIRVPFLASWPGHLPKGVDYDEPVSALDIFATAAAIAGADTSAIKPLDGVDLMPYLTGEKKGSPHDALYWRVIGGQGWAIREGDYKLVNAAALDKRQLFDLAHDPRETHDLSKEHPEIVSQLKNRYDTWNSQLTAPRWTDPHEVNVAKEHKAVMDARDKALPK